MKGKTGKIKHNLGGPKKGVMVILGAPKKHGGKVEGKKPHERADKRARGGATEPKKWIAKATEKKGALHKNLGVPADKKIPEKKLEKATHSENPKIRKEVALAKTLKRMH